LVGTTQVYSGTGADIVMESFHSNPLGHELLVEIASPGGIVPDDQFG